MPTVLVIDDNQATCDLMRLICTHAGCEFVSSFNASVGLELARQINPNVIFIDLQLPGEMDGWQAIRHIRYDDNLRETPIVAMSAGNHRKTAAEAGSSDYMDKPFSSQQVVSFIQRYT